MPAWFKKLISPPTFDDPEKTRLASLTNTLLLPPLIYCLIFGLLLLFSGTLRGVPLVILSMMYGLMFVSLIILRRGLVRPTGWLFMLTVWVTMTYIAISLLGGMRGSTIGSYLLVIIASGLLLGRGGAIAFAGLSLLTILVIQYTDDLLRTDLPLEAFAFEFHILNLILATGLVLIAVRYITEGFERAQRKDRQLTTSNQQLRDISSSLEEHVVERTAEILEQKQYFESLVLNSPLGIVTLDEDHRIVATNPAFEALFQYREADIIGEGLDALVTGDKTLAEAQDYTQSVLDGKTIHERTTRRRKDGEYIDVEIFGVPVIVDSQQVGAFGIYHDITERKRTREALKQQTSELTTMVEVSKAISSTLEFEDLMTLIAQQMINAIGVSGCALYRWDNDADVVITLTERSSNNAEGASRSGTIYPLYELPILQTVLEKREPESISGEEFDDNLAEASYFRKKDTASYLFLPLTVGDQVIGLVELNDQRERQFTSAEIRLCQALADQAAVAMENAQLHAKTQGRLMEQTALRRAGAAITSTLEIKAVMNTICEQLCQAVNGTSSYISLYNQETTTSIVLAEYCSPQAHEKEQVSDLGKSYTAEDGLELIDAGIPGQYHVDDADLSESERTHLQEYGGNTVLTVPLQLRGRTIAYVEIWDSRQKRIFTPEEVSLCQDIARQAAIAIENARLHAETQRRLMEQTALREAGAAITSTLDLDVVLSNVAEQACRVVDGTSSYISIYDEETTTSTTTAEHFSAQANEKERLSDLGETYEFDDVNEFLEAGIPEQYYVDDPDLSEAERAHLKMYGGQTVLLIPMQMRGKTIAYIEIWDSRQRREFTPEEVALLQDIAQQAAIAIENVRLLAETQRRLKEQTALREAGATITSTLDLNAVLSNIAEQTCLAIDGTSAFISEHDQKTSTTTVIANYISPNANEKERVSDLGASYVFEEDDGFIETRIPEQFHIDDPGLAEFERDHLRQYGGQTVLYIPMHLRGKTVAYVEVWDSRRRREFTPEEVAVSQDIAQQAAIAIENAQLFEGAQREITDRLQAENALRESEEKYRTILENIQDSYFEVDLTGNFTFFNDSLVKVLGYTPQELMGMNNRQYMDKENAEKVFSGFNQVYKTGEPIKGIGWELIAKDGSKAFVETSISLRKDPSGEPIGFRGIARDITERMQVEQRLRFLATHDPLTQIPNRTMFFDRLTHAVSLAKRKEYSVTVMFLDLNNFKYVNDKFGHEWGDEVLKGAAERFRSCLRDSDTVARVGGDEFAFVLENSRTAEAAATVAEKILAKLSEPFEIKDQFFSLSASIGISLFPDDGENGEALLKKADGAMYIAKERSRSNFRFAGEGVSTHV